MSPIARIRPRRRVVVRSRLVRTPLMNRIRSLVRYPVKLPNRKARAWFRS
jgi:hypothetical protein